MNKRAIKVVKRDAKEVLPPEPTAEESIVRKIKDAADDERDMIDSVKSWITERVENSRAEGARSKTDRLAWDSDGVKKPK